MIKILNTKRKSPIAWRPIPYKSGDVYNRLMLTGKGFVDHTQSQPRRTVEYICECGMVGLANFFKIKSGHTTSCGCFHEERKKEAKTTHGLSKHLLHYSIWHGMKNRCYNVDDSPYPDYGGRGIRVCDEWLNDFMSFYNWAIANGYKEGLEIDRINNDGNYEPSNCRFTTRLVQSRNRRSVVILEAFGDKKCIAEWPTDSRCKVSEGTLRARVKKYGWDIEKAISTPPINKRK